MVELTYNGFNLASAEYGVGLDNWNQPAGHGVDFADLYHGEPVASSASLNHKTITGTVWLKNPTGTTQSLRDAEEALARGLEMGVRNKQARKLTGRTDTTQPVVEYDAICSGLIAVPERPFEWEVAF